MPPRPRPRPVARPASQASSSTQASSQPASNLSATKSARERELDNDDHFFMRNRSRTAQDWKRLESIERGLFYATHVYPPSSSSRCDHNVEEKPKKIDAETSGSESEGSTPRKKRKIQKDKKSKKSQTGLPEWTRQSSVT